MPFQYVLKKMRRHRTATALSAALLVVGGCAGQPVSIEPAASVSITRGAFDPIAVTVQTGEVVTWRNNSVSPQSITATAFRSGMIAPGATFSNTFTIPGTYRYAATVGTPVGTVIVTPVTQELPVWRRLLSVKLM